MAITQFSTVNAALGASKRGRDYTRYIFTDFSGPLVWAANAGGAAAAVTDAAHNVMVSNGYSFQGISLGAFAGSAPQFVKTAAGAKIVLDAADNDGFELNPGYITDTGGTLYTAGQGIFVAGTDTAFVRAKFKVTTSVLGADFIAVGFRKVEALQADLTGYADYFVLNIDNGAIKTLSEVAGGGTSTTDTTQTVAIGDTVELEVRVSPGRVAKGFVNGKNPTVEVTNYSFTNALALVPFFHVQLDVTALDPVIDFRLWESGTFEQRGLDNVLDTAN